MGAEGWTHLCFQRYYSHDALKVTGATPSPSSIPIFPSDSSARERACVILKIQRKCMITARRELNAHAVQLDLLAGDMVRTSFRAPGQFVHIRCSDSLLLRRPISVCTCACGTDEAEDRLSIVFEVRGEGTTWLAERRPGETLDILGLLGNGFSMKPEGRYLLAGGGIGVPPLLGCALQAQGRSAAVLGFRSAERAILTEEFSAACDSVCLCSDDGSLGQQGFVDAAVRQVLSEDPGFDAVLACGPRPMLKGVAQTAASFGIPCQVSMEQRMGCGVGACLVCVCDMADGSRKHVCSDGPVFDAREVDWNA